MVPSVAMAMPLRVVMSAVLRSSCAEVAAPPSPTEPTSPIPAMVTIDLVRAAAATGLAVPVGAMREKTRSGLSTDVTRSRSAVDAVDDEAADTDLEICSVDGGATAKLRTPMLVATMVGAIPFEALGAMAEAAAGADDDVEVEVGAALCDCAFAFEPGFSSAIPSESAAKIATTRAHRIRSSRTHLPLSLTWH